MADTTYVDFVGPAVPAAWLNDVNRLTYDIGKITAGTGASLVGINDQGGFYSSLTVEAALRELADWRFGNPARQFGSQSDTTALLNQALATIPSAGLVTFPRGTWTMTSGFTHNGQRFNMLGEGRQVTNIDFRPAGTDTAITLNYTTDTGGMFEPSIVGFGFTSGGGNTQTKTAISLVNVANAHIRDITIGQGAWAGTDSTFLKTAGRQSLHLHGCDIACDRPIVVAKNATFTTLSDDFFLFEHLELIGTSATRPVMEFLDGVMHTSTTIRNTDFALGQGGIKWVSTTSAGTSYKLKIENCRFEQSLDATSWCIDLQENTASMSLQDVTLDGVYFDNVNNGIRLRNAQRVTLRNCTWSATNTKVALDMTFVAGSRLVMENCFSNGATFTLTNARCIRREETSTSNSLPGVIEEWVFFDATNYATGCQQSDVFWGGVPVSVANNATIDVADINFTGFLMVSTSEDVSAIYALTGGTGSTNEVSDPFGFFSITSGTAASVNIFFSAGKYKLENKRGATITVSVFRIGTSR